MTGPLAPALRARILRFLLLGWRPDAIALEVYCSTRVVYNIEENLFMYGSLFRPQFRTKGAPRKITEAAKNSMAEFLNERPYSL